MYGALIIKEPNTQICFSEMKAFFLDVRYNRYREQEDWREIIDGC
jgi:hypothetical protein